MAGKSRTQQENLISKLRTQSLLAHICKCAGVFDDSRKVLPLSDLSARISSAWQAIPGHQVAESADVFSMRRLERWTAGERAGRELDDIFLACDGTNFGGAREAYLSGPAGCRLFEVLSEPIDSDEFFDAANVPFDELCAPLRQIRLSEIVSSRLVAAAMQANCEHGVTNYLTTGVAFLRYALVSLHSVDQLMLHVTRGLERLATVSKQAEIAGRGVISWPLPADDLADLLTEIVVNSRRFRGTFDEVEMMPGMAGWRQVVEVLVPPPVVVERRAGMRR